MVKIIEQNKGIKKRVMKANAENEKNSSNNKLIQRLVPWKKTQWNKWIFQRAAKGRKKEQKYANLAMIRQM